MLKNCLKRRKIPKSYKRILICPFMEFMTFVYLFFILVSLYLTFLALTLHYKNRGMLKEKREPSFFPKISILTSAYNEEENIANTINAVLNSNYPKDKLELIVVNDESTDNTLEEMKKFGDKIKIIDKKNSGKADSLNHAAKFASGDIVAIVDADSYPNEDAIRNMVGYFEEEGVGAVTSTVLVKNRNKRLEKLQSVEYIIIALNRKLLQFIDGIYVTNGPLSMYKREVFFECGGFDHKNLTEDIELTWNVLSKGYKVRMDLNSKVYTTVPSSLKNWWKQRIRWNLGGLQTMTKYKHTFFNPKYGMMGLFVAPFFMLSFFLSFIGLGVFSYVLVKKFFRSWLMTKYSYVAQSSFLRADQLNLNANVFALFAILLIFLGVLYLIYSNRYIEGKKIGFKDIPFFALYLLIYLSLYPFVLIHSLWRYFFTKKREW